MANITNTFRENVLTNNKISNVNTVNGAGWSVQTLNSHVMRVGFVSGYKTAQSTQRVCTMFW